MRLRFGRRSKRTLPSAASGERRASRKGWANRNNNERNRPPSVRDCAAPPNRMEASQPAGNSSVARGAHVRVVSWAARGLEILIRATSTGARRRAFWMGAFLDLAASPAGRAVGQTERRVREVLRAANSRGARRPPKWRLLDIHICKFHQTQNLQLGNGPPRVTGTLCSLLAGCLSGWRPLASVARARRHWQFGASLCAAPPFANGRLRRAAEVALRLKTGARRLTSPAPGHHFCRVMSAI